MTKLERLREKNAQQAVRVGLLYNEVLRLRAALEAIAAPDELLDANEGTFNPHAARFMQQQARAALAEQAGGGKGD